MIHVAKALNDWVKAAIPSVVGLWLAGSAFGCTSEAVRPATVEPPACKSVAQFGNGAACSNKDLTLAACGSGVSRMCADSWLCFDGPELYNCACEIDSDCVGRSTYVNAARTAAIKAPISSKCEGKRCVGL